VTQGFDVLAVTGVGKLFKVDIETLGNLDCS
jgi:hypothetical protein